MLWEVSGKKKLCQVLTFAPGEDPSHVRRLIAWHWALLICDTVLQVHDITLFHFAESTKHIQPEVTDTT